MQGIQRIHIAYCGCPTEGLREPATEREQCWREGWLPASVQEIRTVATLDCLEVFYDLSLDGKLAAYEFYQMIVHRTDNTGIAPPNVSF